MLLENHNAISDSGYPIVNSLRFQSASSQFLSRTPASSGSQTTWTWSAWVKRGVQGTVQGIFDAYLNGSNFSTLFFTASNTLYFYTANSSPSFVDYSLQSDAVFRDSAAWYHIILVLNTTSATQADRCILYVNGVRQSVNNPDGAFAQNVTTYINSTNAHNLGRRQDGGTLFDGYMAEVNFIDGQALTPSSFGETDTTTGQWVAKKYTGTYGTNGFYLPFSNGTSTTTLGADSSGNSNNWTLNNFTRSAGVSDCWMNDVPSGNGSSVGGTQPNSNYAVMNSAAIGTNSTLSAANLDISCSTSGTRLATAATFGMSSGKWYWEYTITASSANPCTIIAGITTKSSPNEIGLYPGVNASGWGYFGTNGNKYNNNVATAYGASHTTNDVIGVTFDADVGTLTFYKNGTSQGTAYSGLASDTYFPAFGDGGVTPTYTAAVNFGQRSFAYTPPTGFKALCTANLPAATIKQGNQYMDATTYSGTGANGRQVSNSGGFEPGMIWVKNRSSAVNHIWQDTTRGVGASNALRSDTTGAESGQFIDAVNSTGYVVNGDAAVNGSGSSYVGWQWKTSSSTVTNTSGSISSQVRANPTAGVSVVTFTATGANSTVGHGLGVAPKMVITKSRNNTFVWYTWHTALAGNEYLELSTTVAKGTSATLWNSTIPTSSVLSFGSSYPSGTNLVAYCFSEIAGFSKFGSYTGNGSADGPFVYTGFMPKYVMIKASSSVGDGRWFIWDSVRSTYNAVRNVLQANDSGAEGVDPVIDFTSNGFKLRSLYNGWNQSSATYIFMAFATNPFQNSNAF